MIASVAMLIALSVSNASAGTTCHQVGPHLVCNDDNGGQTRCGYVGTAYKCW